MFTDLSNRGPEDQAFLVGYQLGEWQQAVQQIAQAVVLLSRDAGDQVVRMHVCMQADTALVKISRHSLNGLKKPDIYYEMAAFLQQPDPLMIGEYARMRRELGYQAPIPEMETMAQEAISKLSRERA